MADTATTVETTAGSQVAGTADPNAVAGTATPGADAPKEAAPKNAWEAFEVANRSLGEGKDIDLSDVVEGEPPKKEGDEKPGDDKSAKPNAAAAPEAKDDKKPDAEEPGKEKDGGRSAQPRYQIVDANGDEFEIEWPDGAKVVFKGSGRKVEAENLNDLVELAQKGVDYDRQGKALGERATRAEAQIGEFTDKLEQAELILLTVLSDPDAAERVKAGFDERGLFKRLDPEYREGLKARQALEARTAQDKDEDAAARLEQSKQVWDAARSTAEDALDDYEYLEADDLPDVINDLHGDYVEAYQTAYRTLARQHPNATQAQLVKAAHDSAEEAALTEEHLFELMQKANEKIGRKISGKLKLKAKPDAGSDDDDELDEEDADKAVAAHNKNVQKKLEQRKRSRGTTGGGSAPGGGGTEEIDLSPKLQPGENAFDAHMRSMRTELHR